jgi:hypothetical protein
VLAPAARLRCQRPRSSGRRPAADRSLRRRYAHDSRPVASCDRPPPEGIALAVSPASALSPVLAAAQAATCAATGTCGSAGDEASALPPHLTVCYSTGEQPAAPVIAELGKAIPACKVTIDRLSLVVQNGPEQVWDWRVAGTALLG